MQDATQQAAQRGPCVGWGRGGGGSGERGWQGSPLLGEAAAVVRWLAAPACGGRRWPHAKLGAALSCGEGVAGRSGSAGAGGGGAGLGYTRRAVSTP